MSEKRKNSERFEKFDMCNAASFDDCTGLIQVPPQDEYDSYKAVYDFAPPEPDEEDDKEETEEMYL